MLIIVCYIFLYSYIEMLVEESNQHDSLIQFSRSTHTTNTIIAYLDRAAQYIWMDLIKLTYTHIFNEFFTLIVFLSFSRLPCVRQTHLSPEQNKHRKNVIASLSSFFFIIRQYLYPRCCSSSSSSPSSLLFRIDVKR